MAQITGMEKYKFRRALEEIEAAQGRGTELVTVYVPPERPISDVTNYLRGELSQSSNIKSAGTRKNVTQAIESAMQRLKGYRMPPPTGLGVLRGKRIEVIKNLQSQVPSKHRMGGQSARRFERGHDIAVHEWYKKIGELMTEAFLTRPEIKGIIIGGPGYSKEEFATGEFVHHELRKKILPTFLDV